MNGVKRCLVGYTGGTEEKPTYMNIADYTEALLIEYEPSVTDLTSILKEWKSQASPYPTSCQYRTALWFRNEEQKEQITNFVGNSKYIDIEPATQFFMGEEYHQNFLNKQTQSRAFKPVF
mmetsp:Transcript_3685/g.4090  ORF Transcript_3685/g.4090 Transcript_3685/m.4090 type:complete len:120 (+) Transcript_3685:288-647(+)